MPQGGRLSRHIMKRILRGRLINTIKRCRAASEMIAAVNDITCFELVE
jgi:hypothetical protein